MKFFYTEIQGLQSAVTVATPMAVVTRRQTSYLGGAGASGGGSSKFLQYGPPGVPTNVRVTFLAGTHSLPSTTPAGSALLRNCDPICGATALDYARVLD